MFIMVILREYDAKWYKGRNYKRFGITIPKNIVDDLGWEGKDSLKIKIVKGSLVISKEVVDG